MSSTKYQSLCNRMDESYRVQGMLVSKINDFLIPALAGELGCEKKYVTQCDVVPGLEDGEAFVDFSVEITLLTDGGEKKIKLTNLTLTAPSMQGPVNIRRPGSVASFLTPGLTLSELLNDAVEHASSHLVQYP